ncbi:MAG: ATP-dependent zinc protease [Gammaproteobacteria bacterium]
MPNESKSKELTVGWREWVGLPDLGIDLIKAKVDTGARTSAIHAFDIRPVGEKDRPEVEFKVQPNQRDSNTTVTCRADVVDERTVTNSGGQREKRWVVSTVLSIGGHRWPIELTLTSRKKMKFRMLLGRTAIRHQAVVDPSRSYIVGKKPRRKVKKNNA